MKRVYLSLGSNLGDRVASIRKAIERLGGSGIEVRRLSALYKTEPVDLRDQPWFVNCAAEADTDLMPLQMLKKLKAIERALGRRAGIPKGPRTMDIDILLYGDTIMQSTQLTIPHPRLAQRRFVLVPLREIAPGVRHPVTRRTILEMLEEVKDPSQVVRMKGDRER